MTRHRIAPDLGTWQFARAVSIGPDGEAQVQDARPGRLRGSLDESPRPPYRTTSLEEHRGAGTPAPPARSEPEVLPRRKRSPTVSKPGAVIDRGPATTVVELHNSRRVRQICVMC